jgi:hypothetical protein
MGETIMAEIKNVLPLSNFMTGKDVMLDDKLNLSTMTNCRNIRPLITDMLGQYCFNFIGQLGGFKHITISESTSESRILQVSIDYFFRIFNPFRTEIKSTPQNMNRRKD